MNIVDETLERIPLFAGKSSSSYTIERLGGLTNLVYNIDSEDGHYVLRIAGEGTEAYIDRKVEENNARVAAKAGVTPEIVYFDTLHGLMLTRYAEGSTTMSPALFKNPDSVRRTAVSLRQLHRCRLGFQTRFDLFAKMDEYLALIAKLEAPIPDGYADVKREAQAVRTALAARPATLAPCHCDPLAENFLDTNDKTWIVDWEYSGMNDPMWDLGDLSVEAEFDADQDHMLLQTYFEGEPPRDQYGRMILYKAMCDLLWTLWGVIQHANDNPADDFWSYAVNRFERCKALMGDADFGRHLQAVRSASRGD